MGAKKRLRHSRPKRQFAKVIDRCEQIRKALRRLRPPGAGKRASGNERDVLRNLRLLEHLARLGMNAEAEVAIDVADHIELVSQRVDEQIEAHLARLGQVRTL